ncbi:Kynureninase [Alloactinosynnema sp. L-07]|uniref:kynureninase n=1 Tax=Alloactinosynnema sp. L-07 TaxID=1653480 RepID=UPI00065EF809|nr:kynureninase [Alloactinosynnema sp. L-07]CRK56715.1 Kynureninase [Alloactinosynnema sp. L-07]
MTGPIGRELAEELDSADPLAGLRDQFVNSEPAMIYLDGNSLGRLPAATPAFLDRVVREGWGTGLVRSWHTWIDWANRLGDRLAEHVLGARPGEVVVSDSTSVNLFKLASAALDANPKRRTIVIDAEDFPTNRYIMQGLADSRGLSVRTIRSDMDNGLEPADLRAALDDDVALVVLSLVAYRCGALMDMGTVNDMARRAGAFVLWDVSHAAGVVPIDLDAAGADLAVGCTYKYLNGGPGSPAFLYVRRELHSVLRQPIWGWFGQRDQFDMGVAYDPVERIERFLVSTPPLLSLAAIDPALTLIEEAGVDRLRDKGMRLTRLVAALGEQWLVPLGFRLASPADPRVRGSHVSFEHPDAWRICRALATTGGVVCDYRMPDRLRIGPSPAYTSFVDVWDAMDRIRETVARGDHEHLPHARAQVT